MEILLAFMLGLLRNFFFFLLKFYLIFSLSYLILFNKVIPKQTYALTCYSCKGNDNTCADPFTNASLVSSMNCRFNETCFVNRISLLF